MADFTAVLRKTLDGMTDPTPEVRAKVYERARATINRQIDAMPSRPSDTAIERQFEKLDAAIAEVEAQYAPPPKPEPEPEPEYEDSDLDHFFEDADKQAAATPEREVEEETELVDPVEHILATPPEAVADEREEEPEPGAETEEHTDPLAAFLAEQEAAESAIVTDIDEPLSGGRDALEAGSSSTESDEPRVDRERQRAAPGMDLPVAAPRRRGLVWALIALVVLAGAAYAGYANQDRLLALFNPEGSGATQTMENGIPVRSVPSTTVKIDDTEVAAEATPPETDTAGGQPDAAPEGEGPQKFTQRLTPDGQEVDEGPANAPGSAGEGTSVSGLTGDQIAAGPDTQPPATETPAATETSEPQSLPVGQRAIFYQERTGAQAGTAEAGAAVWSVVQESPGGEAPLEPAVRVEASIPELGLTMEMTIRRNADETFPASHVIELFFRVPDTFEGRGIADVQRITFKGTEQDPGNALIGVAAPLDTNIFLIALTDAETAIATNLNLMRREQWIDIPMQYVSGRRALITLEKGIPGEQVFKQVLDAWDASPLE
jgi:hypothetical protein